LLHQEFFNMILMTNPSYQMGCHNIDICQIMIRDINQTYGWLI
jgi:hypothetical protein